jgi:hypothetical protein
MGMTILPNMVNRTPDTPWTAVMLDFCNGNLFFSFDLKYRSCLIHDIVAPESTKACIQIGPQRDLIRFCGFDVVLSTESTLAILLYVTLLFSLFSLFVFGLSLL